MSALGEVLDEYLALRRAVGFKLEHAGHCLPRFVAFLDVRGERRISVASALEWAAEQSSPPRVLTEVRVFARYAQALDPANEVPPVELCPRPHTRPTPYLYSAHEVHALMEGARSLEPEVWAATCETVIGLLWASGMRIGEVLRLDRARVSLESGVVTVWHTKFKKSRHVPLTACTSAALGHYVLVHDRHFERPSTDAFFVSKTGRRVNYPSICNEFVGLLERAGIPARPVGRPRLHDFRHSFAVRTLLGWYRSDENVGALLPRLSTYLGHSEPASTYWYLSAAPELMALAAERLERAEGARS